MVSLNITSARMLADTWPLMADDEQWDKVCFTFCDYAGMLMNTAMVRANDLRMAGAEPNVELELKIRSIRAEIDHALDLWDRVDEGDIDGC